LTVLPWERNWLLPSTPLFVAECWTKNEFWPQSQFQQNWHFTLGPLVHVPLLSWRHHIHSFI
jgi:hypothetical protein